MREHIGLIGNGGHANEVESYTPAIIDFRAVTKEYIGDSSLIDIENPPSELINLPVHIAVGAPYLRKRFDDIWKGDHYKSIVSQYAIVEPSIDMAEGCLIAPQAVITTEVKLGRHAIINVASSVQHNTSVGNFVTIGPGVRVGGNVEIGDGVFLGIGSVISNNIRLAPGVVLGAGSTLLHDADKENGVYVGTPAKCIKINKSWLSEI